MPRMGSLLTHMPQSKTIREYVAKIVHDSRNHTNPPPMNTIVTRTVNILFAIVMLPIVVSAGVLGKQIVNKLMNRERITYAQPQFADTWQRYAAVGIEIDSPETLYRDDKLSQSLKTMYPHIDSMEIYTTVVAGRPIGKQIIYIGRGIGRFVYNLDLGMAGAVRMSTAEIGDHNPSYTCVPTTISGLSARYAKYRGTKANLDMIVATNTTGDRYWQMAIITNPGPESPAILRFISSITITP